MIAAWLFLLPKKRLVPVQHDTIRAVRRSRVSPRLGVTLSHLDLHRNRTAVSPNSSRFADAAEARTCAAAASGRRVCTITSSCWKNTNSPSPGAADRRRRRSASRHSAHSAAVACTTKLRVNRPRACVSPVDHHESDGGGKARPSHECTTSPRSPARAASSTSCTATGKRLRSSVRSARASPAVAP